MTVSSQAWGKKEKLKSRKQIGRLFSEGKRINVFPFLVYYLVEKGNAGLVAGFGVSSRNFKKAVDRNRIKRLGREAYRLSKSTLLEVPGVRELNLSVFFIYTARELPMFGDLKEKMEAIMKRLEKECQ